MSNGILVVETRPSSPDDTAAAKANLAAAQKSGKMSRPQGVQLDPPPVVRSFESLRT